MYLTFCAFDVYFDKHLQKKEARGTRVVMLSFKPCGIRTSVGFVVRFFRVKNRVWNPAPFFWLHSREQNMIRVCSVGTGSYLAERGDVAPSLDGEVLRAISSSEHNNGKARESQKLYHVRGRRHASPAILRRSSLVPDQRIILSQQVPVRGAQSAAKGQQGADQTDVLSTR